MTEKEQLVEKEFKGIDQALRRASQAAKKLAEQNGTPYVVFEEILPLLNDGGSIKSKINKKTA